MSEDIWGETNTQHVQALCEELQTCMKNHRHQTLVILMTMFREFGLLYVLGLTCTNLRFVTILLLKKQINFITFLCLNSFSFQLDI